MNCTKCGEETRVVDSRPTNDGAGIRRRRRCIHCGYRFTTEEVVVTGRPVFNAEQMFRAFDRIHDIAKRYAR